MRSSSVITVCVYEGESYRDSRLGRSHGASSGSLSNWLFCSILKEKNPTNHSALGVIAMGVIGSNAICVRIQTQNK